MSAIEVFDLAVGAVAVVVGAYGAVTGQALLRRRPQATSTTRALGAMLVCLGLLLSLAPLVRALGHPAEDLLLILLGMGTFIFGSLGLVLWARART